MLKIFQNSPFFPELNRVRQDTAFSCGPATLVTLLSNLEIYGISQDEFFKSAGIAHRAHDGMTVWEMGTAIRRSVPEVSFWYKSECSIGEIAQLTEYYKYPVGVEWQGEFDCGEDNSGYDDEDDDTGHYSVVTHVDFANDYLTLANPYDCFAGKDTAYTIKEFEQRWWDTNEIFDPLTKTKRLARDHHMMFIVTPKNEIFPIELGMRRT